jgi:hypothetical protein
MELEPERSCSQNLGTVLDNNHYKPKIVDLGIDVL